MNPRKRVNGLEEEVFEFVSTEDHPKDRQLGTEISKLGGNAREQLAIAVASRAPADVAVWERMVDRTVSHLEPVKFDSSEGFPALLLAALFTCTPSLKADFIERFSTFQTLNALSGALPLLDLSLAEAKVLFQKRVRDHRIHNQANISRWAALNPDVATRLVADTLGEQAGIGQVNWCAAVEGCVWAEGLEWREEIVDNLLRTGREELWGQAVRILLSSWPRPSPPFNLRFERAGQVTALLPRRLVLAAFDGLRRDAFEAPNEVVEAATALVHIIPIDSLTDDERRRIASAYIGLLALALRQEQCENTLGSWFEVALAALPACVASHDVDAFCKEVHERDPTAVARALRARVLGLPLQRIETLDRDYPLLVEAAGKRGAWGLLWTLALDRDPAVRFVAQVMIAGAPDTPTSSVVDEMDFRLKQIFVHELLGVAQADGKRAIALLRALYR